MRSIFAMLLCLAYAQVEQPTLATEISPPGAVEMIALSSRCPASFELIEDGTCQLRTLYQQYGGVSGHGGQRAALPPLRQGFTPQQIDLGRLLFFDPMLSGDKRTSCAHCHNPAQSFTDGKPLALGLGAIGAGEQRTGGVQLKRRTPTLWNVGFLTSLFWDGRARTLEEQAEGPLTSPQEMNVSKPELERLLNANENYRKLFATAYPDKAGAPIAFAELTRSLAAFESTLVSLNSRYDRYAHGDTAALNTQEIRGLNTFRGFVARCSQCHTPPLFTNNELAVIGAPVRKGLPVDIGAAAYINDLSMRGAFRVPTLRNISKTGPNYFQAGQIAGLEKAVEFYNAPRGHALPKGEKQDIHWHVHMRQAKLSKDDVQSIVAFLGTLDDETPSPDIPAYVPSGLRPIPSVSTIHTLKE